jgi:hypothetical protein
MPAQFPLLSVLTLAVVACSGTPASACNRPDGCRSYGYAPGAYGYAPPVAYYAPPPIYYAPPPPAYGYYAPPPAYFGPPVYASYGYYWPRTLRRRFSPL